MASPSRTPNAIALIGALCLNLGLCGFTAIAQSDSEIFVPYPDKTTAYLKRIQQGQRAHAFESSRTFASWQQEARQALGQLIGLPRMQRELKGFTPKVSLGKPEVIENAFTRSLGTLETEPGVSIPFYILIPTGETHRGRRPLMLCPHGHDTQGHHSYAGAYLNEGHREKIEARGGNIAEQAARRGFIAIAPATRGLASEVLVPDPKGRHGNRPCRAQLMHCLVAGRTPLGERVWDMQRLLDWACAHPRVDTKRILMTGNSGGGVLTAYTAALDTRVAVAIPSCSFTALTSAEGYLFHCDCCLVPGLRDWGDWREIGGLVAPRHLLLVHGRKDGLHHHRTVDAIAQEVQTIYRAAGAPDHMTLKWGAEGHRFYPELMWPFVTQAFNEEGERVP